MADLKPCPFCGGKAKIYSGVSNSIPRVPKAYVYCEKCYASGKMFSDSEGNGEHIFKSINAWNRRAGCKTSEL